MAMISRAVLRTQPDGTLATLAAAGSEPAFEVIVHRYRRPLLRYCRRLALSENRSEDVVQQTFLNAWGSLRQGSEVRELRPWLYRITHNQAITLLRAAGRDDTPLSELMEASTVAATAVSAGVDDVFEGQARLREALSAVAALPALQREALLATAVDGLSYDEAAGALNTSADAVRGLVYRARNALRTGVAVLSPAPLVVWAANGAGSAITAPALQQWVSDVGAGSGTAGLSLAAATRGVAVLVSSAAVVGGTAVGITEHGATSSPRSSRSLRSAAAPRPTGSSHAGTGASHRALASGPATPAAAASAGSATTGQREARRSGAVFTAAAVHTGDAVGTGVLSTGASAVARSISTPTRTPAPQAGGRPTASSSRGDDGSGSGVPPAAGDRAWAPQGQAALTPSLRSAAGSDAVMPPADGSGWSPGSRGASGVQTASPRAAGPPGNSGAEGMTGSAGPGATGGSTTPADPSASTTAATPTTATTTTATTPTTTAATTSATGASPTGASPASSVTSTTPATATTPALDTATALLGAATSSAADAG